MPVLATAVTARMLLLDVLVPENLKKKELLPLQSWRPAGGFRGTAAGRARSTTVAYAYAPLIARALGAAAGPRPRAREH